VQVVAWAAAILAGDHLAAVQAASAVVDSSGRVLEKAQALTNLAATLAALERWDETAVVLQRFDTAMQTITEPAPALRARAAIVEARLALATGEVAGADAAAHRALRTATGAGLPLIQIDAVETIAVTASATGDYTAAARLVGATTAERQRRGYLGRLTTPATQSLVDQLASTHAGAWNAGAAESLERVMPASEASGRFQEWS
jgi:hypothetical protein